MTGRINTSAIEIEGRVDGLVRYDIAGWAWRPDAPDRTVIVAVVADGRVLARTQAEHFRADLEAAGKRGGRCAFRIAVGALRLGGAATIEVHAEGRRLGEPIKISAELASAAEMYVSRLRSDEDPTFDPSGLSRREPSKLPIRLTGPAGLEGWLERFDAEGVIGWAARPGDGYEPVVLSVVHEDREIGRIEASAWRLDLAELRQGDGRIGIDAPPPPRLLDGHRRDIDIRDASTGLSVLDQPLTLQLSPTDRWTAKAKAGDRKAGTLWRRLAPRAPRLSVIVNFYNMHREAARTLMSLSRRYQLDADDIEYEVICVDNGSDPPIDEKWIADFGPEFRLFRPSRLLPSPCFALNEAARSAKGDYVALMIDGAHVLSPGVYREVMAAVSQTPVSVVGLRQWFIGGDQRWLSAEGYSRQQEDIAFARIGWPSNGYRLFEISTPMMPSPNSWFDSVSESNFLVLPSSVLKSLQGYDETFDIPGGGLANLDLFSRAVDQVGGIVTMIIGEASFHQYHGGTTTNVDEASKDAEVRRYQNSFYVARGERLKPVAEDRIRYHGRMAKPVPLIARQRPAFPAHIGVTSEVRPVDSFYYFDEGAKTYLRGYACEAGIADGATWFNKPTGVAAGDLLSLQEILSNVRPACVVATNASEGLLSFLAVVLGELNLRDTRLISVGNTSPPPQLGADVITIAAPIASHDVLKAVELAIGAAEDVIVVFHPDEGDHIPIESLRAYMRFVTMRSYLVFTGTVLGQPWLGYSTRWYRKAVQMLTGHDSEFRVDPAGERHLITACPNGYLRRVGKRLDELGYDAALDDLGAL
jgi:cephalosporin hydroxylase